MQSLNRTMQYGNALSCAAQKLFADRLNRTMQYGNPASMSKKR